MCADQPEISNNILGTFTLQVENKVIGFYEYLMMKKGSVEIL